MIMTRSTRSNNPYIDYYVNQVGSGLTHFKGSSHQKGHGLGSFLGGLFRSVLPLFKSGARAVGREALKTGANVLGDLVLKRPFKESVDARIYEAGNNLKRKANEKISTMTGSGLKSRKRMKFLHSIDKPRRVNIVKLRNRQRKKTVRDIFN